MRRKSHADKANNALKLCNMRILSTLPIRAGGVRVAAVDLCCARLCDICLLFDFFHILPLQLQQQLAHVVRTPTVQHLQLQLHFLIFLLLAVCFSFIRVHDIFFFFGCCSFLHLLRLCLAACK